MKHYFLITILVITQVACASAPRQQYTQSLEQTRFQPNYRYEIKFRNGATLKAKGSQLQGYGNTILVSNAAGQPTGRYHANDIVTITGTSDKRHGSYALPGMGIGAAALGLPLGIGFALTNCDDSGDKSDCEAIRGIGILAGGVGGALVGAGIGALIGYAIPKKAKVTITPTYSKKGENQAAGLGMSLPF